MKNKAVVLGVNYYIGLSTIRCLGIKGIYTVAVDYSNHNLYGGKSKYASELLISPYYKENPEGFIQFLINYAKRQELPPVLIPCHDSYVEIIDEYLDLLRKYFLIPQTEAGLYTRLMNKDTLSQLAQEHGMKVPETISIDDPNFIEKIDNIIKFPCIVKPTDSPSFVAKFRKKLFKVHNFDELEKAISLAREADLEVIVQRIIPGFDDHMYTFDAYLNQESKVTHWVTCQKFRQYPINFGASVYTGQKYVPELYEIGATFLEAIKYKGFAEIEFKKDAITGDFYLIEINVRITNLNSLLYKVGVNIPYITYKELVGEEIDTIAVTKNTNFVFWYGFEDLLAIRDYLKTGQLTLKEVIKSLFKPKAYAIWDWKDPKPAFAFLYILLKKIFARLIR